MISTMSVQGQPSGRTARKMMQLAKSDSCPSVPDPGVRGINIIASTNYKIASSAVDAFPTNYYFGADDYSSLAKPNPDFIQ